MTKALTKPVDANQAIKTLQDHLASIEYSSYSKMLPLLLSLKGKPYNIDNHFPFEPLFRTTTPVLMCFKAARQIAKSTGLASDGILRCQCVPFFTQLFITPLCDQIRRFSNNYIRPFVEEAPFRQLMLDKGSSNSVFQRSFANRSKIICSFAYLNADRTRGISSDANSYDEVQDLDQDHVTIINESMSASLYKKQIHSGTPKTMDNTLQKLYETTSACEWLVKCHHPGCGHWNIPNLQHDLDRMIGPVRDDISAENPGVICAKCAKPINPRRFGTYVPANPELMGEREGYHIPQIILPMHYDNPKSWAILVRKRENPRTFYNEVCGESFDTASKLITETELKKACNSIGPLNRANAVKLVDNYEETILSIDWGGGGDDEESWTCYAVLGYRNGGRIDVIYGYRSLEPRNHVKEADIARNIFGWFNCSRMVHDYGGSGIIRETLLHQEGFDSKQIVPIAYSQLSLGGGLFKFHAATPNRPRWYYTLDKSRSLLTTCHAIRAGYIRFFDYDRKEMNDSSLLFDFMSLIEEKKERTGISDRFNIIRHRGLPDDFAQAVNIGCNHLWYVHQSYPQMAEPLLNAPYQRNSLKRTNNWKSTDNQWSSL